MRTYLAVLVATGALLGCPSSGPAPRPAPPFVGDVEASCADACGNLRRLDCPEGKGSVTGETCERRCVVGMELRMMPLSCWAQADTVAAAKGCGSLRCVR